MRITLPVSFLCVTILSLATTGYVISCTPTQASTAQSTLQKVEAVTQKVEDTATGVSTSIPAPLNNYAGVIAAIAAGALVVEKAFGKYVIPFLTKQNPLPNGSGSTLPSNSITGTQDQPPKPVA
jgi:hypothetical protein